MTIMIKDIVDALDKTAKESRKVKRYLVLDPYSLAALREEIGLDVEDDLTEYHGYKIQVKEDEYDLVKLI
jgi:hypothetical protein